MYTKEDLLEELQETQARIEALDLFEKKNESIYRDCVGKCFRFKNDYSVTYAYITNVHSVVDSHMICTEEVEGILILQDGEEWYTSIRVMDRFDPFLFQECPESEFFAHLELVNQCTDKRQRANMKLLIENMKTKSLDYTMSKWVSKE